MKEELLPQVQLVKDTDLITMAYELHLFAGDFIRESEFNIRTLVTNMGSDSIAIMGHRHMWLSDAVLAYCSTADLHQMIFTTEYLGAKAFLFHTDHIEDGRLYGDVLMMDLDELRQDVKKSIIYPLGVSIEEQNGAESVIGLDKWRSLSLAEKSEFKSWGFHYDPEQVAKWQDHYSNRFSQWKEQAFSYMAQDLEDLLNTEYMEQAQNADMNMYRIPLATAKQMLLYDEAPVYRLLPSGAERIAPIEAVTTGLWYQFYREFAVSYADRGAVDKLVQRETERLTGKHLYTHMAEKKHVSPDR